MNRPMMKFSPVNPTGETPGMEPLRLDVLKAAVNNQAPPAEAATEAKALPETVLANAAAPAPSHVIPLINKNIRLPADLVDFIDYTYTKEKRMKKQDAYTEALETYFRPLMTK